MKLLTMWSSLSLFTLLLLASCNTEAIDERQPTATADLPTTQIEKRTQPPSLAAATAVSHPTNESTQPLRLTPVATLRPELVPTIEETAVIGEVPAAIMSAVYKDLSSILNLHDDAFTVTRAEAIIWNDGSLGCPQPGEVYTQATVSGYWITLEANGRSYDYHAAENGTFILCNNSQPPAPSIVGTPIS